jgi:hypothetical protein
MKARFLCLALCLCLVRSLGLPAEPHVTLIANRIPLSKALAELAKTGTPVENRRTDDPTVDLNLKGATFWQALDAIARASDSQVAIAPRDGRIALVRRKTPGQLPVSHSGPFRIALRKIAVSRDLESGNHQATLGLEVAWEPSLQPLFLETVPLGLTVQVDRESARAIAEVGSALAPVDGRIALAFDVALPAPPRSASRLTQIEGRLSAVGPTKMLHFDFGSLARPDRSQSQEGLTCRIAKVTPAEDHWTVQVILDTPPGAEKLESFQSWVVNNVMTLQSTAGKARFRASSYVLESASDRRVVISYHFADRDRPPPGKPDDWKVTYTAPAAIVTTTIPFRFRDVPLP